MLNRKGFYKAESNQHSTCDTLWEDIGEIGAETAS